MSSDPSDAFGVPVRYEPGMTLPFSGHLASSNSSNTTNPSNMEEWSRLIKQAWDDQFSSDMPPDYQAKQATTTATVYEWESRTGPKPKATSVNEWESRTGPKPKEEPQDDSDDASDHGSPGVHSPGIQPLTQERAQFTPSDVRLTLFAGMASTVAAKYSSMGDGIHLAVTSEVAKAFFSAVCNSGPIIPGSLKTATYMRKSYGAMTDVFLSVNTTTQSPGNSASNVADIADIAGITDVAKASATSATVNTAIGEFDDDDSDDDDDYDGYDGSSYAATNTATGAARKARVIDKPVRKTTSTVVSHTFRKVPMFVGGFRYDTSAAVAHYNLNKHLPPPAPSGSPITHMGITMMGMVEIEPNSAQMVELSGREPTAVYKVQQFTVQHIHETCGLLTYFMRKYQSEVNANVPECYEMGMQFMEPERFSRCWPDTVNLFSVFASSLLCWGSPLNSECDYVFP